jgi:hypothetical protein
MRASHHQVRLRPSHWVQRSRQVCWLSISLRCWTLIPFVGALTRGVTIWNAQCARLVQCWLIVETDWKNISLFFFWLGLLKLILTSTLDRLVLGMRGSWLHWDTLHKACKEGDDRNTCFDCKKQEIIQFTLNQDKKERYIVSSEQVRAWNF